MAAMGAWLTRRLTARSGAKTAVAIGLAAWVWAPGTWGGAYWLGLAFQAPSGTAVVLCALLLWRLFWWPAHHDPLPQVWPRHLIFLALCGVTLGWVLLLDTLGVWSASFYNWGFGAAAPAIVLGLAALPWVITKKASPPMGGVVIAMVILFFVAVRVPTGNLFDALIDPWLWCFLQLALIQQWRRRYKRVFA